MNELVNLLTTRTGMSAAQAQEAIQTVLGFVKQRLPAPMAGELDKLMAGGAAADAPSGGTSGLMGEIGEAESIAQGLGGMFGKQK